VLTTRKVLLVSDISIDAEATGHNVSQHHVGGGCGDGETIVPGALAGRSPWRLVMVSYHSGATKRLTDRASDATISIVSRDCERPPKASLQQRFANIKVSTAMR
jgi:hypothetical protein